MNFGFAGENTVVAPGISFMEDLPGVKHCYSYFPVFVDEEKYGSGRDALYDKLK